MPVQKMAIIGQVVDVHVSVRGQTDLQLDLAD
jgi:hypothetical protein